MRPEGTSLLARTESNSEGAASRKMNPRGSCICPVIEPVLKRGNHALVDRDLLALLVQTKLYETLLDAINRVVPDRAAVFRIVRHGNSDPLAVAALLTLEPLALR